MELYIHFGIYKAGSSFIQHLCSSNRSHLINNGIYFPTSEEDHKMDKGLISAGNISGLDAALWQNKKDRIQKLFYNWIQRAKKNRCQSVLISGESLIHFISIKKFLELIIVSAHNVGFAAIKAMGFLRPILDHAISTYKHRAKTGKHSDIAEWIQNHYEAPVWIERLNCRLNEKHSIKFSFRMFKKDSEWMTNCFFVEWLGITEPSKVKVQSVNASLTLSEIRVIQLHQKECSFICNNMLYRFQSLNSEKKANDYRLERTVRSIFSKYLRQYGNILTGLGEHLPPDERVRFIDYTKHIARPENFDLSISLSDDQIMAIQSSYQWQQSVVGRWGLFKQKFLIPIYKLFIGKKGNNRVKLNDIYSKGQKR